MADTSAPLTALAFATAAFIALLIFGLGMTSLALNQDVIETPGLGQVPGIVATASATVAFAAGLWASVRRRHPSFWGAAWTTAAAFWPTSSACGSGLSRPEPTSRRAVGRRSHRDVLVRAVVAGAGAISAWGGIALVRHGARRPRWPGRTSSTSDPSGPPDAGPRRYYRCLRGALARNPGQSGGGRLALVAAPWEPATTAARRALPPLFRVAGALRGGLGADVPHGVQHGCRPASRRSSTERWRVHRAQPPDAAGGARSAGRPQPRTHYRPGEGLGARVRGSAAGSRAVPGARSCSRSPVLPKRRMPASPTFRR
jgi:hypothetical protein